MTAVVIAVGNRMRGDDAVGPIVLDRLRSRRCAARLVECAGDVSELLDAWRGVQTAVVVDAVVSGSTPGTIHEVDGRSGVPPAWRSASTHLIGLGEAIALGAALDVMPDRLTILGVEAASAAAGAELSPPVADAVAVVVERVMEVAHA